MEEGMTDNERISKWLGECRHPDAYVIDVSHHECPDCHKRFNDRELSQLYYDSDPGAWTPALYQKIEDAGITEDFCEELPEIKGPYDYHGKMAVLKATPAQKTAALVRALQEMEDKE